MAKKKSVSKTLKDPRIAAERALAQIGKQLEKKNFQTIEEANEYLKSLMGKPLGFDDAPLMDTQKSFDEAQELAYDAMDEENRAKRIKLAKKAISIHKDCADAYNILAEEATTLEEMKELYHNSIAAAKRRIGDKAFEEMKGHFWGFHETRPYMRAMAGLADVLWAFGQKEESVNTIKEMLSLNPNDNQGMRYSLINKLLFMRKYSEADKLLKEYDENTAHWLFSKAYLYFNKPSMSFGADKALIEAMRFNPYVPLYLFGIKEMPKDSPEYMSIGDATEAIAYSSDSLVVWGNNEKAIKWFTGLYKKMENELNDLIIKKEKERRERFKNLKE